MRPSLKKLIIAAATGALLFAGSACSQETQGTATVESAASTSHASGASDDPSSESDPPATGTEIEAQDGSFTTIIPDGFIEATDQTTTAEAILELAEQTATNGFNTTIIVASAAVPAGTELETAFDELVSQVEQQTGGVAEDGPTGEVDGAPGKGYTIEYTQDGRDLATAQVVTVHDGTAYFFTVNCDPSVKSEAGDALAEVLNAVTWA